ncbi:MAG: hypothetical protein ABIY90_15450 [Puia sp.]
MKKSILLALATISVLEVWCQIRIMPLGNSITSGDNMLGYRDELYKKLVAAGYTYPAKFFPVGNDGRIENGLGGIPQMGGAIGSPWVDDIGYNGLGYTGQFSIDFEGHGGFQAGKSAKATGYTDHALAQMVPFDIPRFNPQVILMELGTNDMLGGWTKHGPWPDGNDTSQHLRPMAAANNVLDCVDLIRKLAPDSFIFVAGFGYSAAASDIIKTGIDIRIGKGATNLQYVWLFNNFTTGDLSPDKVHPSRSGYLKMAQSWFEVLKPRLDIISGR